MWCSIGESTRDLYLLLSMNIVALGQSEYLLSTEDQLNLALSFTDARTAEEAGKKFFDALLAASPVQEAALWRREALARENSPESEWKLVFHTTNPDLGPVLLGALHPTEPIQPTFFVLPDQPVHTRDTEEPIHPAELPSGLFFSKKGLAWSLCVPAEQEDVLASLMVQLEPAWEIFSTFLAQKDKIDTLKGQIIQKDLSEARIISENFHLSTLINQVQVGIMMENDEGVITVINDTFRALLDIDALTLQLDAIDGRELLLKNADRFEQPDTFKERVTSFYSKMIPIEEELLTLKDGRILECNFTPMHVNGIPIGQIWICQDVTERHEKNQQIRSLKNFYEQILNTLPVQLAVFDSKGRYVYITPSAIDDQELRDWLIGKTDVENCMKQDIDLEIGRNRLSQIQHIAENKEHLSFEENYVNKGVSRHFIRYVSPVIDLDGKVSNILSYALDITDRVHFEEKLKDAQQFSEDAIKVREYFLTNISHEMRTPLSNIIGMSHLLAKERMLPHQKRSLDAIQLSANHLVTLINDTLDYTRIQSGDLELEQVPFVIEDVVQHAVDTTAYYADEKDLELHCTIDEKLPASVIGDPERLTQVLVNLIMNAVKYTDAGKIQVNAQLIAEEKSGYTIGFDVADTGSGIPDEYQKSLFSPPAPDTNNSISILETGSGLGLAIVRQLVELQEGTVGLESRPEEGSIYSVILTYQRFKEPDSIIDEVTEAERLPLSGYSILLVEDNVINQMFGKEILARKGADVAIAEDGYTALEILEEKVFDLILMDIRLPGIDGYETSIRIRSNESNRNAGIPILALSAADTGELKARVLDAGMNDFVRKPFEPDELTDRIVLYLR